MTLFNVTKSCIHSFTKSVKHLHLKECRFMSSSIVGSTCDLHVIQSPFPSIPAPPYAPLPEFVSADWKKSSGALRNKVAIVDGYTGQSRTFRNYHDDMGNMAANLKYEMGIFTDSTVALFAPNHVDYIPICLATALCGAKLTPINPQYTVDELSHILESSSSKVLICHHSLLDVALNAAKKSSHVKHVVVIPKDDDSPCPEGTISLTSLKKHSSPILRTYTDGHDNLSKHPFLLPYSSGTTGLPKGVCLSHNNVISNLLQLDEVESMAMPTDHRLISPLPFYHIYGFVVSALYAAWRGQQLVTMSGRFDLELFCQLVEKYQPHRAHLVPPIMIRLAKSPIVEKYNLSSVKMILSAAAPLSKDTEEMVFQQIGALSKQAWGMSELSPLGTMSSDYNMKSGSIGQLVPNTYGKVIDPETGRSLPSNEIGELMIKGPQVMMGYLNDPDKTAECLSKDGWLKTGDVAYYDDDGFFYITDRLKELIKVRGYQVAPAELEALLLTNLHISDAAVIPIQDENSGEVPRAYVSLKTDVLSQAVTEQEIKDWVKERVAPFKRLEGGVVFIDQVPKSPSGKILRRLLVEKAKREG